MRMGVDCYAWWFCARTSSSIILRFRYSNLVLLQASSLECIVMWSTHQLYSSVGMITHANSTNHSSSTTVRSRMKLFVVSTTSWNMTHPVDGCLVNITELGWTFRIAPSRAERYVPSGCILAAFYSSAHSRAILMRTVGEGMTYLEISRD